MEAILLIMEKKGFMALPLDVMDVLGKEEMLFVKGNETDIVLKKKHDLIFDDKMYNVVINTTLDCNLNCWYCYEYKNKRQPFTARSLRSHQKEHRPQIQDSSIQDTENVIFWR